MNRKIINVEVKKETGEIIGHLEYYNPGIAETDENGNLKFICDGGCTYFKICPKLRDPRHPEDKDLCFVDFCQSLGTDSEGNRTELADMCPVDGTLEANLANQDIFQDIVENRDKIFVSVDDVIKNVCKGEDEVPSFPCYNDKHSNCVYSNEMCILKSLFPKTKLKNE